MFRDRASAQVAPRPNHPLDQNVGMTARIEITDYDPTWAETFQQIRAKVQSCLGDLAGRTEHVGSTAVPGLAAKPIVDVDVLLGSTHALSEAIARLSRLGYRHEGDLGTAGREAFYPPADMPYHHLYVCPPDSDEFARHIAFRNYLRDHPEAADEYAGLKRALAAEYRNDREAYGRGKRAFIEDILRRTNSRAEAGQARPARALRASGRSPGTPTSVE